MTLGPATERRHLDDVEERELFGMLSRMPAPHPALAKLPVRLQRIITLRFYGNQTQGQIAEQFGISQMHVSRLLAQALAALRQDLAD